MHILNLTLCGTEFFVDFGKSTGLMDLFREKLCYKKLQRRKSKDLRDFLQRVTMGKRV